MPGKASGSCLCGAVTITTNTLGDNVGACHCHMCRRWSGGPLLAIDCGTDVEIDGVEHVATYDSSEWAERAFCKTCGSNLFYRLKESGQYMVGAGLFEPDPEVRFASQVFIDSKPDYYDFANDTKNLTGQQVFELYG